MKIVLLDAGTLGSDIDLSVFDAVGDKTVYNATADGEVAERIKNADVVVINKIKLNENNLSGCKNLKLIDCTTDGCDLSFEYSDLNATVRGHIHSVKNPASGRVVADSIGEVIWEDSVIESSCDIVENTVK